MTCCVVPGKVHLFLQMKSNVPDSRRMKADQGRSRVSFPKTRSFHFSQNYNLTQIRDASLIITKWLIFLWDSWRKDQVRHLFNATSSFVTFVFSYWQYSPFHFFLLQNNNIRWKFKICISLTISHNPTTFQVFSIEL